MSHFPHVVLKSSAPPDSDPSTSIPRQTDDSLHVQYRLDFALDAGLYYYVAVIGLTLQVLGVFMTSLTAQYWQLLLAQAICQGLGNGLVFTPTMALVSTYFSKRRAVAIAGMSSGTATWGMEFSLIARQMLGKVGFAWTVRTMGFVILTNAVVVIVLIRPRRLPRKNGPLIELAAFKDPWYSFFGLGLFLALLGIYFGYYFVSHGLFHTSEQCTETHIDRSRHSLKISYTSTRLRPLIFC